MSEYQELSSQEFEEIYNQSLERIERNRGFAGFAGFAGAHQNEHFNEFDPFVAFVPFVDVPQNPKTKFPVECLPSFVGEIVKATAESLQVPVDMPAVALGIISTCVQGKFVVNVLPDWTEQINLYVLVIARPSERKTPVLKVLSSPLYKYVKEENEIRKPRVKDYITKRDILTNAIENLKKAAASCKGIKGELVSHLDVMHKQAELDSLEPVYPLRLTADNTTLEKLASLMVQNNGKMAIISAEGGLFDMLSGQYNNKDNVDLVLKSYSCEPIQIDRIGRPSEMIDEPHLTLMLLVQPQTIQEVMENDKFRGRGLTARFLYSWPESMIGKVRKFQPDPINQDSKDLYESLVYSLLKIPDKESPDIIKLSKEAKLLLEDFHYSIETRLAEDLEPIEEWAGKIEGTTVRIAGLLHCCIYQEHSAENPIDGKTMKDAISIAHYFIDHAKFMFDITGASESREDKLAKYILKRLEGTGENEISKRNLFDICHDKSGLETTEDFDKILRVLVDRGYIAIEKTKNSKGGRPSEKIKINPEAIPAKPAKPAKLNFQPESIATKATKATKPHYEELPPGIETIEEYEALKARLRE